MVLPTDWPLPVEYSRAQWGDPPATVIMAPVTAVEPMIAEAI